MRNSTKVLLVLVLLVFIACRETETTDTTTAGTTTETAATATPADTTTTAATSTVPPGDLTFATEASNANLAEIMFGQLAGQKAAREDVKRFGHHMVESHTKIGDSYVKIAQPQGLPMPTTLNPTFQAEYDKLNALSGAAFDRAYIDNAVMVHEEAKRIFTQEKDSGQDPQLKGFAGEWLPTVEQHLDEAKKIQKALGQS